MANPYHDSEGKFTSQDKQGSAKPKQEQSFIKLKTGVDLSSFPKPQDIQVEKPQSNSVVLSATGVIDTNFELTMPISIQDAIAQGNKILGSNSVVAYDKTTNLEQALELNKGLKAVVSVFPKLFEDNQLLSYGTAANPKMRNLSYEEQKQIMLNVFNKEEYNEPKERVRQSGIDVDVLIKSLYKNAVIGMLTRMFRFKDHSEVGGITKAAGLRNTNLRSPCAVQFNPKNMSHDIQMSIAKTQQAVDEGHFLPWGDKTPTFATSTHELGHHCYNQLHNFMDRNEQMQLFDLTVHGRRSAFQGEISGYAATNKEEQIAEAFSDFFCRGDGATKHNKNIVKFFMGVYNRVFGAK